MAKITYYTPIKAKKKRSAFSYLRRFYRKYNKKFLYLIIILQLIYIVYYA